MTAQHSVSSIKEYWVYSDPIELDLRTGQVGWWNRCRGRCGRRQCFEYQYFRVNIRLRSRGFCSSFGWRHNAFRNSPVLPILFRFWALLLTCSDLVLDWFSPWSFSEDVAWKSEAYKLADFLEDKYTRMLCLTNFWRLLWIFFQILLLVNNLTSKCSSNKLFCVLSWGLTRRLRERRVFVLCLGNVYIGCVRL